MQAVIHLLLQQLRKRRLSSWAVVVVLLASLVMEAASECGDTFGGVLPNTPECLPLHIHFAIPQTGEQSKNTLEDSSRKYDENTQDNTGTIVPMASLARSGSSNFKIAARRTFTYSPLGTLQKSGYQKSGMKFAIQKTKDTFEPGQELSFCGLGGVGQWLTPANTRQN